MTHVPAGTGMRSTYENFAATCPSCHCENIFNRATDLHDFRPIGHRVVSCQNPECRKEFSIGGDSVNAKHEMLIFDCYELLPKKHYMACVLTVAQAYEVFFSLFLRVELLYKPFATSPKRDIDWLNKLSRSLEKKVAHHTFARLRALFLRLAVLPPMPQNLADAESAVMNLPDTPQDLTDAAVSAVDDAKLRTLLLGIKKSKINELRNKVVHHRAYRATQFDAESAIEEARSLLFSLTSHLRIEDDINWYTMR